MWRLTGGLLITDSQLGGSSARKTTSTAAMNANGTVSAPVACPTDGERWLATATRSAMPPRPAMARNTSTAANDSQAFAGGQLPGPASEYQSRNIDASSTTPETPAIHSPCRSLRRSTPRRVPLRRRRDPRLHPRCREGVLKKHRDGHRPHPARHRSDRAGLRRGRLEVHVALQAVVGAVHAHVDHG